MENSSGIVLSSKVRCEDFGTGHWLSKEELYFNGQTGVNPKTISTALAISNDLIFACTQ
jgi:hypothetical protein